MPRIAIVSQPLHNRGDESAHRALVRSLLRSLPVPWEIETLLVVPAGTDARHIEVEDARATYTVVPARLNYRVLAPVSQQRGVPLWLCQCHPTVRALAERLRRADAVVCAPGGICLGGFTNWEHLFVLRLAQWLGKPTYYFGRSIGPFSEATPKLRTFKRLAFEMLGKCRYVSLRDAVSCGTAVAAGLHACGTTDAAFLDEPPYAPPGGWTVGQPYVVVVPNALTWHHAYRASDPAAIGRFYQLIINHLCERLPSHRVVMLPQLCRPGRTDERDYMLRLCPPGGYVAPSTWSSDEQQSVVRGADLVVGARYHSIVFALNQGRPFVSLSYEHKMSGLLQTLGLTGAMVDLTGGFAAPGELAGAANALIDANLGRDMTAARTLAKTMARAAFDEMINQLTR